MKMMKIKKESKQRRKMEKKRNTEKYREKESLLKQYKKNQNNN